MFDYAFLYTDPGSGQMILQLIFAAMIGASFYARRFWQQAKMYVSRKRQLPESTSSDSDVAVETVQTRRDNS